MHADWEIDAPVLNLPILDNTYFDHMMQTNIQALKCAKINFSNCKISLSHRAVNGSNNRQDQFYSIMVNDVCLKAENYY